jgi:hypothetical protein
MLIRAQDIIDAIAAAAVPVGTIITNWSSNTPAGYIYCDGRSIASGDQYIALRAIVGNNVPDFRGCFLRGAGGDAAAVGTKQLAAAPNITGKIQDTMEKAYRGIFDKKGTSGAFYTNNSDNATRAASNGDNYRGNPTGTVFFDASKSSTVYSSVNEIRPVNYAVYYYIKY